MKSKIPVTILGATGVVGQRFISLLQNHPYFEIGALAASDRSAGKKYKDACNWVVTESMPESVSNMIVQPLSVDLTGPLAFSALPTDTAKEFEPLLAEAGMKICSNASAFREDPLVPLLIPEVNAAHLGLIAVQQKTMNWKGFIVTSPNCTATTAVMPLKPLDDAFGLQKMNIVSLQAISGAGIPGVPAMSIMDNVIPYIGGEEEKLEMEPRIMLGSIESGVQTPKDFIVSAQVNRVPILDGHTVCLSLGFKENPTPEDAIRVMEDYEAPEIVRSLPSAPEKMIIIRREVDRPQPRLERDSCNGMVATVGRVRACPIFDLRMVSVIHNAIRGAAGGAILNAELLVAEGYIG
ncbi:MAG: aspartate-semialdehyde dehydrogenase [Anaerolineales bacterium]|nr:aspartate-semialdehyde dehydrogenase [Anaerolineales bacterium]